MGMCQRSNLWPSYGSNFDSRPNYASSAPPCQSSPETQKRAIEGPSVATLCSQRGQTMG